jgi:hypothetical protein
MTHPPVEYTSETVFLHPSSPPSHRSVAYSQNLGGLPPRYPFSHCSKNHFVHFHRSLHCSFRVPAHALVFLRLALLPFAAQSGQIVC